MVTVCIELFNHQIQGKHLRQEVKKELALKQGLVTSWRK